MAWPGPKEGHGQGGPRLKWAKGRSESKIGEKVKVLRMEFSTVEKLSGLQAYLEVPKSIFAKNVTKITIFIKFTDFPLFPLFGVPWAAVIL